MTQSLLRWDDVTMLPLPPELRSRMHGFKPVARCDGPNRRQRRYADSLFNPPKARARLRRADTRRRP